MKQQQQLAATPKSLKHSVSVTDESLMMKPVACSLMKYIKTYSMNATDFNKNQAAGNKIRY